MWRAGLRGWRCDVARLSGRPDVAFTRHRLVVFVDGGFWHGHPSKFPRPGLTDYWLTKIARNTARDRRIDKELLATGWRVLRLWDFELSPRRIDEAVARIAALLRLSEH